MAKYQWVQQQSGEDCAAASLAIVARHYGRDIRIDRIREAVATDSGGTSFASLARGARSLGFLTKVIQADDGLLDRLQTIALPAIIFWNGYHVLVLYGRRRGRYVVSDPALGIRHLTRQELLDGWQGRITLLLQPHPIRFWLQESDHVRPWRHLFRRLAPHRRIWGWILLASALAAGLGLGLPVLLGVFVDEVLLRGGKGMTATFGLALCVLLVTGGVVAWRRSALVDTLAGKLAEGLTNEFGSQLLNLPLSYYESRSSGLVRNRLGDLLRVSSVVTSLVADLPLALLTAILGASVLAFYDVGALALVGGGVLLDVCAIAFLFPRMRQAGYRVSAATGETFFVLAQFFSNALTIRTVGAASHLETELTGTLRRETEANTASTRLLRLGWALTRILSGLGLIAVLWWAAARFARHGLTPGKLVAVCGISLTLVGAAASVALFAMNAAEVRAAARFLEEVFTLTTENAWDAGKPWTALSPTDDLACEDISFQYAGRAPLFRSLSTRFAGGAVSALVGPSGCGKSTLACLIAGLYRGGTGSITIGRHRLSGLPVGCVRKQVTLVPQEARFLTRSVADNVRLGVPEAGLDDIEAACRLSTADRVVRSLPEGYETVLGDFGARLSAGERQRLAVARALLLDPAVLILDECTSSLDPGAEAEMLDHLLESRRGKTTILISHRPSVIRRAEWIVELENGQVRFAGPTSEFRRASRGEEVSEAMT